MEEGYKRASKILAENRETLIRLAEGLLEYETLDSCEIEAIIKGESVKPRAPISTDEGPEGEPSREKSPEPSPVPQIVPKSKPAPA